MPTAFSPPSPSRRMWLTLSSLAFGLLALSQAVHAMTKVETPDPLLTESLTGKRLRVVHPNQPVTMDYSESRVNVEVDAEDKIKRIFVG